jgi:hypothetical protein
MRLDLVRPDDGRKRRIALATVQSAVIFCVQPAEDREFGRIARNDFLGES